ncbi:MAG: response regulator [Salibacteraceae bacterium]
MPTILLIEDNETVRENTAEILELAGYEVLTAADGKQGVEIALTNNVDLIVCDIMMPELDGYGVLHILSKNPNTASVPFIFLTAKAEKSDFRKGMNLGADDYLTKPFEEMELLQTIERRLNKASQWKKGTGTPPAENTLQQAVERLDLKDLLVDKNVRKLEARQQIYRQGEYPKSVYYLRSGKVKLTRISDFGKEFLTAIVGPGEFFGYMPVFENETYQEDAITLEPSEVLGIDVEDFKKLIHLNREISARFIKLLAKNALEQEDRLLKLAYGNVRERVAYVLLHIYERYHDPDGVLELKISREELAGYTGIATESLIRTLSELKAEKIIEIDNKQIRVIDPQRLAKLAKTGIA